MIRQLLMPIGLFLAAGALVAGWARWQPGFGLDDFLAGRSPVAAVSYTLQQKAPVTADAVSILDQLDKENTRLIEAVTPAVVSINTKRIQSVRGYTQDWFFGGLRPYYSNQVQRGEGSGVIVTTEGYVITNKHVIDGMDEIEVTLHDDTKAVATLIGADPIVDIAVLKIQGGKTKEYPALPFDDSDKVKVGQQVWAIGNPFGLSETVTFGHISHRDRQLGDGDLPIFQHDAVIEPGNSGGPLINTRGEIIGINQMIYSTQNRTQAAWQGISFAIQGNIAKRAFERIMQNDGRSTVGFLGVLADTRRVGRTGVTVAVVTGTLPGSPAEKVGFQRDDIVLKFAGKPVDRDTLLYEMINQWPIGEAVEIVVHRGDADITLKPTVIDRTQLLSEEDRNAEKRDLRDQLGIEVQALNEMQRQRVGLVGETIGIHVTAIAPGSEGEGWFYRGDVILSVDDRAMNSVDEFMETISHLRQTQKQATVRLWRRGQITRLNIELPAK
jgi:S1-C subfamily serine protease